MHVQTILAYLDPRMIQKDPEKLSLQVCQSLLCGVFSLVYYIQSELNTLNTHHCVEDMHCVAIGYGNETFAHRPTDNILHILCIRINECPNNQKSHLSPILSPNWEQMGTEKGSFLSLITFMFSYAHYTIT